MIHPTRQIRAVLQHGRGVQEGFTLIELMIVVAIIGVLTVVAMASYDWAVTKTRRKEAAGCAETAAQFMERNYTTALRYDKDSSGAAMVLPGFTNLCPQDLNNYYSYALSNLTATTYTITLTPKGIQSKRDKLCAKLTIDQKGTKGDTGTSSGNPSACW